jgi:alpha-beta hydrolase superfamily lysophospholipase
VFIAHQTMRRREPDAPTDPRQLGLDYEPVTFFSRDGLRLGGWFVPAASRARGTVILCHGHAGSLDADLHYVPAFHRHGYGVLQFDFRAHGRSEGQHVSMGYLERQDLLGAIDFLRARGISKVGVLGFSMGGAVAISTAAACPSIVGIVSDGGFGRIEPTLQTGIQQRGIPSWLARILAAVVVRLVGWRLSCHLSDADPVRWIGRISPRPILLIHGGRDRYVPASAVEMLYAAAGEPKELWTVPEAEHRRVDQVRPEEYITRVLAFFDSALT